MTMDKALKLKVKDALKKADLDEALVDDITITNEEEIPDAVKKMKDKIAAQKPKKLTNEEFIKAIKEAGLDESLKGYLDEASKSEIDRRVGEAIKTHDAKLKKEAEEAKTAEEKEKARAKMTDEQKIIASLTETVEALNKKVDNLSQSTSKEALKVLKIKALEAAELDVKFADRIVTDDPEKIADEVAGFKEDIQGEQQKKIDELIKEGKIPEISTDAKTLAEDKVIDYAKAKNVESEEGGGISPAKKLNIDAADATK